MTEVRCAGAVWGKGLTSCLESHPWAPGPPSSRGLPLPAGLDVETCLRKRFMDDKTETLGSPWVRKYRAR